MAVSNVHLVYHALVQHKLSLMRDRDRSTKAFRELLNEIGMLLCYEVTRDLPFEGTPVLSDEEFERASEEIAAIAETNGVPAYA